MSKNSSLFDLAPELVKEWHPSANGTLTPRKVTIGHTEKVWWICRESHEWKATIKSRLKGNECPVCTKSRTSSGSPDPQDSWAFKNAPDQARLKPTASAAFFDTAAFNDNIGHDFRKIRRYKMKATAVLESPVTGHWVYADLKNFSAGGMGFETDACINPGTRVIVKLDRPLFISNRKKYDSIIRWCKELDREDISFATHSMGAQFI